MANTEPNSETYSEEETVALREAAWKRMLVAPHKPHTKLGGKAETSPPRRSQKKPE